MRACGAASLSLHMLARTNTEKQARRPLPVSRGSRQAMLRCERSPGRVVIVPLRKRFAFVVGNDRRAATASRSRRAFRASVAITLRLPNNRGRRECRARDAPAASRAIKTKHTSVVTTVTPASPGIPRAMVLTAYSALSPVTGLSCHRRQQSCLHRLDASVGASGPHALAVRGSMPIVADIARVHCLPHPTS